MSRSGFRERFERLADEVRDRYVAEEISQGARALIYCCGCEADVEARLTNGLEVYRHRPDLHTLPFWKCDACGNYVGCHHKTSAPTRPSGCIPTREIRDARKEVHMVLDPLWQSGRYARKIIYRHLSDRLGRPYHTGETRSLEEIRLVLEALAELGAVARREEA